MTAHARYRSARRVTTHALAAMMTVAVLAAQDVPQPPAQSAPPAGGRSVPPNRRGPAAALANPESLTVQQVEQLFDRYVLGQARTALQLGPEQMLSFGPKLQQLQMVRRRNERQRQVLLNELNALSRPESQANDEGVGEKLRALDELSRTTQQELDSAYQGIDSVLTARQRARFRVFERRMEQQKLDLISRARQQARGAARGGAPVDGAR